MFVVVVCEMFVQLRTLTMSISCRRLLTGGLCLTWMFFCVMTTITGVRPMLTTYCTMLSGRNMIRTWIWN